MFRDFISSESSVCAFVPQRIRGLGLIVLLVVALGGCELLDRCLLVF
jgi:uncharacterized membrane-anchored protein